MDSSLFRKHYFFWLDDQIGPPAARALRDVFKRPELFHISVARGLYSALQVLDAIKNKSFPPFDLAVLDVRLKDADQYFAQVSSLADTSPLNPQIYIDDKAELNKVEEFSGPDKFGFDFAEVKTQAMQNGGLFVWAWAVRICSTAKYIIYSASEDVKSRIQFLRIAGILEVCNKTNLFHVASPDDYAELLDVHYSAYETVAKNGFPGIQKIKYVPLLQVSDEGGLLSQNCLVEKRPEDFVDPDYFGSTQWRTNPDLAFVIHDISPSLGGNELRVTYERYADFEKRIIAAPTKPYIVEKLIEVLHEKIERGEIDRNIADTILLLKDSNEQWTAQIADGSKYKWTVSPYELPLGGRLDVENKTVTIDSEEEAKSTYTFAAFFLPWAGDLVAADRRKAKIALSEIEAIFGNALKNGCALMREFCASAPFNDFIENSATSLNRDDAERALRRFKELKVESALSEETQKTITSWLSGDSYAEYLVIKHRVELELASVRRFFEEWKSTCDQEWSIDIASNDGLETGKWYADVDWIKSVLKAALGNLIIERAFDPARGFAGTPTVKVTIGEDREPDRLMIVIQDNGAGLQVSRLKASSGGYRRLLQGKGLKLLRSYGELTVRSGYDEFDWGTGRERATATPTSGTCVTFSVLLG
jgi:hypothetical protein